MGRSASVTPFDCSSRWMAAVSEVLPSPGAPLTAGTSAIRVPSLEMLPVVWSDNASFRLLAVLETGGVLDTPDGSGPALEAIELVFALGSQLAKEPAAFSASALATSGVMAVQGSAVEPGGTRCSPEKRVSFLPLGSDTSMT